ncbi:hypothetical protein [uncultured Jatrophihabitans sp.]|uniref:hypothetical protein n=1 Tax=uncultured Jatrophihabitans sp. TaxID=1610747 RepID=UPI0035CBBDDC
MTAEPMDTEYIVIRAAGDIVNDSGPASHLVGEWLVRSELDDDTRVELDGANGVVSAYPTERTEEAPGGFAGQVYEVRDGAGD